MNLCGYAKREFFTISELDAAARCARKYFYQCGVGLRPAQSEAGQSAMFFGTCIHKAIGVYFSTFDVSAALAAFEKSWTSGDFLGDDKRNVETARMMLFSFSSHHPGSIRKVSEEDEIILASGLYTPLRPPSTNVEITQEDSISDWEIPFAVDLGVTGSDGRSLPLVGRIDGWCRSNITGEVWLNEFKTTSEMSQRFLNGFKRSPQVLGYTLAARTQNWATIRGVFVEALKVAKTSWDTTIVPVEVADFELEDFVKWAKLIATKILWCEDHGDWPKEPSGCGTYAMFGQPGYFCDYDPLCSVPEWETMKSFFRVERHVPFIMPTVKGKELS